MSKFTNLKVTFEVYLAVPHTTNCEVIKDQLFEKFEDKVRDYCNDHDFGMTEPSTTVSVEND